MEEDGETKGVFWLDNSRGTTTVGSHHRDSRILTDLFIELLFCARHSAKVLYLEELM